MASDFVTDVADTCSIRYICFHPLPTGKQNGHEVARDRLEL